MPRRATGGIDTIIKDRSARWPVPGTKRETLSPSFFFLSLHPSFLSRICSSSFFDRPQFFFSRMSGRKRSSCVYGAHYVTYASTSIDTRYVNVSSFMVFIENYPAIFNAMKQKDISGFIFLFRFFY